MGHIVGLAAYAVAAILFLFAVLPNPPDGRLVPAGLASLAIGTLLMNAPM